MGPLSGDLAFVGSPFRTGALAYVNYVNAHGGVNGHQVQVTSGDDQNTPSVGAALLTQQVQQDSVVGEIEGGSTTVVGALSPLLTQYQIPLVTWSCLPNQVFPPMQTQFCFETEGAASSQAVAQASFALKLVPNAKVLLVPTNNPYGLQWLPAAKKYITDNGGTVVGTSYVPLTGVDMSSAANAVATTKPQVVITVFNDAQAVTFTQEVIRAGLQATPIVNYNGGTNVATFTTLNDPNFYAEKEFPYPSDQSTPGMQQYAAAMALAKVDPNTALVQDGYFAAYVMLGGLAHCGDSCTAAKLSTVFDSLTIPMKGLAPDPFSFSATSHQGLTQYGVYEQKVSGGSPELIGSAQAGTS